MIPSHRVPHPTRPAGPRSEAGERFWGLPIVAQSVASCPGRFGGQSRSMMSTERM